MEKHSRRVATGFIVLITFFGVPSMVATTRASEPSEIELRIVIRTWRNVKQTVNSLIAIPDEVKRRVAELPFPKPRDLTDDEIVEIIELIYITSKRTILDDRPRYRAIQNPFWAVSAGAGMPTSRMPGPHEMRNPFLRDNTGRVDVPVLPPDPLRLDPLGLHGFRFDPDLDLDRTKPILQMWKAGDAVYLMMGERHGMFGSGQIVECRKRKAGGWVITSVGLWQS